MQASVSYTADDGMVAMSSYKVFTLHGSTSFKITKNLEAVGPTFDLSRQKKHPLIDNYYQAIGRGIIAAPTAREFDDNGDWCQLSSNGNAIVRDGTSRSTTASRPSTGLRGRSDSNGTSPTD